MDKERYTYEDLLAIIARLRSKDGCPWDQKQTHESLKGCMLEEAYEVVDAIDQKDDENLEEELGDVLLQVVMHAQIAKEEDRFDIDDVIDHVAKKMIRRHPHIFGDASVKDARNVSMQWEEIKKQEKKETSVYEGVCRVPKALPANMRAQKILKKVTLAGLNYTDENAVRIKVKKDFWQLEQAVEQGSQETIEARFGTLMFDLMNLSRFLGVNAEKSLTNGIEKFINRLGSVESLVNTEDLGISELSPQMFEELWEL